MLTQSELKSQLHYNPETGIFIWIIAKSNRIKAGDIAGSKINGYIQLSIDSKNYYAHRLAWLYMYGCFPNERLDHKNRDKSNNRIDNLRISSPVLNARNMNMYKNNTSGFTGVRWIEEGKVWRSVIKVHGKDINLGRFSKLLDAVMARKSAEEKYNFVKLP